MSNKKTDIQIYQQNKAIDIKQTAWNSLSTESQKAYTSDYKMFFDFIGKDVKQIRANDILTYIEYMKKEGYKSNSINRKIASLSKMFRVIKMSGEIKENPVEMLKEFKNISMKVNNPKLILIIRMLAKTGLRISELIHIKNKDIESYDDNNKRIRIVGKGSKERIIFLENKFLEDIKKVFPDIAETDYLFYTNRKDCFSRKDLWERIHVFFKKTIDRDVHPHTLRHAYITHKIVVEKKDIKSVSRFAGHADVATTLNMYVDTSLDIKDSKVII
jgi:site-specific recombinase XerD